MNKFKHTQEEAQSLWGEALLSKKYEQNQGGLCNNGKYCCLGVLVKVFEANERPLTDDEEFRLVSGGYLDELPIIMEWSGLRDDLGGYFLPMDNKSHFLAFDNDHGMTFPEIEKIIRSRPKGLFVEDKK